MTTPIYTFIRQSFIAIMLLSFSVSVLSSQIGNIPFEPDTSINAIDSITEVGNSDELGVDHCNSSFNVQHCSNCSHCTMLSLLTTMAAAIKFDYGNHYSHFVKAILIEIPIKPPRH